MHWAIHCSLSSGFWQQFSPVQCFELGSLSDGLYASCHHEMKREDSGIRKEGKSRTCDCRSLFLPLIFFAWVYECLALADIVRRVAGTWRPRLTSSTTTSLAKSKGTGETEAGSSSGAPDAGMLARYFSASARSFSSCVKKDFEV